MTARQRLADINAVVDEAIPGLLEEFDDWPRLVKNTRDYLAHWLLGDDDDDDYVPPSDRRTTRYLSICHCRGPSALFFCTGAQSWMRT